MINANDFTFCGTSLSSYGYIIATIDNSSDNANGGNVQILTSRNPSSKKDVQHGFKHGDAIQFKFQIFKTDSDFSVDNAEYEKIMRWLVRPYYSYVSFDTDSTLFFNVKINVEGVKVDDVIRGFEITMTNDSAYGYSADKNVSLVAGSNTITDNSSLVDCIYPKLTIFCTGGKATIANALTETTLEISNCVSGEEIVIDCEYRTIRLTSGTHATLSSDFNWTWFAIGNNYETKTNSITLTNCTATMKYRETRMVAI